MVEVVQSADATIVEVQLVGVDGVEADAGWRLLADGTPHELVESDGCGQTTETEPVRCTLRFDAVDTLQFVEYARVGERRVWLIPQG